MLRYQPPKSNIWGHSLRKVSPAELKVRLSSFVRAAIAEYSIHASSFWITGGTAGDTPGRRGIIERFESLLSCASRDGFFSLSNEQFDKALDEIVTDPSILASRDVHILLGAQIMIYKWTAQPHMQTIASLLSVDFGHDPHISTILHFANREQFDEVRTEFATHLKCNLNEKHLKPFKPKAKTANKPPRPTQTDATPHIQHGPHQPFAWLVM